MTKKKAEAKVKTEKIGKQEVPISTINVNGKKIESVVPLQVLNEMVGRAQLASQVGTQSYDGNRNIYQALGYPDRIQKTDYFPRYKRQDIAKAVIDRPVKASWKGEIKVVETDTPEVTAFEQGWLDLNKQFKGKLKNILMRADKLTGLGRYSILMFGMDDVKKVEDYVKPVKKGAKLVYLKPLSEVTATIEQYEQDIKNPRYGLPLIYQVSSTTGTTTENHSPDASKSFKVHYSRVLHLVEDILEDETLGTPRLEAVWNRLLDLEKVIGGDAEMFWRGARPGYTGTVDKEYTMTPTALKDLQTQIDEFENNLRRVLINEGVDYKALAQQIADPSPHVDVIIQMISAVTGIPKRILVGSERGELSSAQDKQEWISYVASRREEQNEPMILRPFIDMCIELAIIPETKDGYYIVIWDKLFSLSDKEKAEVGKLRAESIKEFTTNPGALQMMPMPIILEHFLGFDTANRDKVLELQKGMPPIEIETPATETPVQETNPKAVEKTSDTPATRRKAQRA